MKRSLPQCQSCCVCDGWKKKAPQQLIVACRPATMIMDNQLVLSHSSKSLGKVDTSLAMCDANPKLHLHPQQLWAQICPRPSAHQSRNKWWEGHWCENSWVSLQGGLHVPRSHLWGIAWGWAEFRGGHQLFAQCRRSCRWCAHPVPFTHPVVTVLWHSCLRAPKRCSCAVNEA